MAAHYTMRTYGVNQAFRFVEGIWLHRKSRQTIFIFGYDLFYIIRAQHVLSYPSYMYIMYHGHLFSVLFSKNNFI